MKDRKAFPGETHCAARKLVKPHRNVPNATKVPFWRIVAPCLPKLACLTDRSSIC